MATMNTISRRALVTMSEPQELVAVLAIYIFAGLIATFVLRDHLISPAFYTASLIGLAAFLVLRHGRRFFVHRSDSSMAREVALGLLVIPVFFTWWLAWHRFVVDSSTAVDQAAVQMGHASLALLGLRLFLAALIEELYFRGALLRYLRTRWAAVPAIITGGVLFAAAHAVFRESIPSLIYFGFFGVVFGALAVWRHGLIAAFTAHAVWNLLFVVPFLLLQLLAVLL
jgi:membrane protease YdiL (CAAX protease family)